MSTPNWKIISFAGISVGRRLVVPTHSTVFLLATGSSLYFVKNTASPEGPGALRKLPNLPFPEEEPTLIIGIYGLGFFLVKAKEEMERRELLGGDGKKKKINGTDLKVLHI